MIYQFINVAFTVTRQRLVGFTVTLSSFTRQCCYWCCWYSLQAMWLAVLLLAWVTIVSGSSSSLALNIGCDLPLATTTALWRPNQTQELLLPNSVNTNQGSNHLFYDLVSTRPLKFKTCDRYSKYFCLSPPYRIYNLDSQLYSIAIHFDLYNSLKLFWILLKPVLTS